MPMHSSVGLLPKKAGTRVRLGSGFHRTRALTSRALRPAPFQKDFGGLMDGLMKQLMSKDIMYEPVKAICDKVG